MIDMMRYDLDRCALRPDMLLISWCRSHRGSMLHGFSKNLRLLTGHNGRKCRLDPPSAVWPVWAREVQRLRRRNPTSLLVPFSLQHIVMNCHADRPKPHRVVMLAEVLNSGGCSDCAFPFFLLKASIPDHEDQTRCNHLNYIFEGTANHNKNILLGLPSKAMLAIHFVDWVSLARWRLCQSDSVRTCLFGSCRRIRLTSRKAFLFGVWLLLDVPDVEEMGHIQAFSVLGVDDSMAWAWVAEKLCVEHPVCVAELADLKSPTCSEVHGVALNIDRCQV